MKPLTQKGIVMRARLLLTVPVGLATEGSFCVHGTVRRRVPVVFRLVTSLPAGCVVLRLNRSTAASDAHPAGSPLPGVTGYRTPRSDSKSAGCRAGDGLPSSRRHRRYVPRPIRRGSSSRLASRLCTASMAFTLISGARHSLHPPSRTGPLTTPQASRHATDCIVAPPYRALDAGLRPSPFPAQAACLLPGLLAATRTGLPPAGDDELANTFKDRPSRDSGTTRGHVTGELSNRRPAGSGALSVDISSPGSPRPAVRCGVPGRSLGRCWHPPGG